MDEFADVEKELTPIPGMPGVFTLPEYFFRLRATPPVSGVMRILTPEMFVRWMAGERQTLSTLLGVPIAAGVPYEFGRQRWVPGPQLAVFEDEAQVGQLAGVHLATVAIKDLPGGGVPQVTSWLEVYWEHAWRRARVTMACDCSERCAHRVTQPCDCGKMKADERCPHDPRQILEPKQFQVDGVFADGPMMGRAWGKLCTPGDEGLGWRWPASQH